MSHILEAFRRLHAGHIEFLIGHLVSELVSASQSPFRSNTQPPRQCTGCQEIDTSVCYDQYVLEEVTVESCANCKKPYCDDCLLYVCKNTRPGEDQVCGNRLCEDCHDTCDNNECPYLDTLCAECIEVLKDYKNQFDPESPYCTKCCDDEAFWDNMSDLIAQGPLQCGGCSAENIEYPSFFEIPDVNPFGVVAFCWKCTPHEKRKRLGRTRCHIGPGPDDGIINP
jgi:hypothetical protein